MDDKRLKNFEWRDFLLKECPNLNYEQINIIKAELANAEYLIDCMSNYYDLQTKIPRIRVDGLFLYKSFDKDLYYDSEDFTININHKLIAKYFIDKSLFEIEKTRNVFLWGIAHEFFHHGRNHIAIWNLYGIKQGDISPEHNRIRRFLEDDADRLATAAIYRHFFSCFHKGSNTYDVKLKVLTALFKFIRLKISSSKTSDVKTHPAWITRLYSQIIKLSELDNIFKDTQYPKKRITDKTYFEQKLLTDVLNNMEREHSGDLNFDLKDYSEKPVDYHNDDKALNENVLDNPNCLVTQRFLDLYYLNETDKVIGNFLRKNCKLPGLRKPTRNWMSKSEQNKTEFNKSAESWLKIVRISYKLN